MFLGQFRHNLDDKGRLTIPARFREELLVEGGYVTRGFDQNLMVLTSSAFEALRNDLKGTNMTDQLARDLRRHFFGSAFPVEIDRVGRMLVPSFLRQNINLSYEAIIVGVDTYFEIWTPERWDQQQAQIQDADPQRYVQHHLTVG